MSAIVQKTKETLDRKLWGGRSLHIGELIVLILAFLIYWFKAKLGIEKWAIYIIFAMFFLAFLIW